MIGLWVCVRHAHLHVHVNPDTAVDENRERHLERTGGRLLEREAQRQLVAEVEHDGQLSEVIGVPHSRVRVQQSTPRALQALLLVPLRLVVDMWRWNDHVLHTALGHWVIEVPLRHMHCARGSQCYDATSQRATR
eukprot:COSAG02_NODE_6522_length_3522_cov_1.832603_2_plen_135_part_00